MAGQGTQSPAAEPYSPGWHREEARVGTTSDVSSAPGVSYPREVKTPLCAMAVGREPSGRRAATRASMSAAAAAAAEVESCRLREPVPTLAMGMTK